MSPGSTRYFLDTNVLVYSLDSDEPEKQSLARALLSDPSRTFAVSAQVLSELYVALTRAIVNPLSPAESQGVLADLEGMPTVPTDAALVRSAAELAADAQLSLWDAQIVVAAGRAGCDILLTEDLNAGQRIAGVQVENPFR